MMDRLSVAASAVGDWFKANARLLAVCFAVGLVCHFQLYSQGLTVFDNVLSSSNADGYGWYVPDSWDIGLGRWGLCFAAFAKSGLCSPVLVSAVTLALFAIGIVALVGLLGIRKTCLKYLAAIVLVCAPFISGTLVYYYCSNSYALCFLCAVLAVCSLGGIGGRWSAWRIAGGSLLLMFALGCYQASMGVFCVAGLLVLAVGLLGNAAPKDALAHFGKLVVVLVAGAGLYLVVNAAVLAATGTSMGTYGGASSVGAGNIISQLPSSVPLAYSSFFGLMFGHGVFGNGFFEPKVMVLFVAVSAVLFVAAVAKRGKRGALGSAFAAVCVALLPLAANIVLVAVPDYGSPTIPMVGGFVASLVLLPALAQVCCAGGGSGKPECVLAETAPGSVCEEGGVPAAAERAVGPLVSSEAARKVLLGASCVALALLAWSYALQCNADSQVMELEQNQVQSLTVRAVDALESNAAVQAGAKVAIVGAPQYGNYPKTSSFRNTASAYALYGMVYGDGVDNNYRCWRALAREFAGVSLNLCSVQEFRDLYKSAEFAAMPNYPSDGSMAEINGIVVLKFSDLHVDAYRY